MSDSSGVVGLAALIGGALLLMGAGGSGEQLNNYVCPYCGQEFQNIDDLQTHVQDEHPGEPLPLEISLGDPD